MKVLRAFAFLLLTPLAVSQSEKFAAQREPVLALGRLVDSLSPLGLFLGALPPTLVAIGFFWFLR